MPQEGSLESFAIKTYRYLRLAIVVVVASALVSVVIERARATCWGESISGYYYTPSRNVFVGALVAIGVSLIAIKGSTDREDILLNLAGVLAPIVAFVPTSPPPRSCSSLEVVARDPQPYIDNNVLSFAFGGAAAIGVAYVVGKIMGKPMIRDVDRRSRLGFAAGVVILGLGLVWYIGFRQAFLDYAHPVAAIAMFFVVGVVIALNARDRKAAGRSFVLYAAIAAAMALSVVAVVFGKLVVDPDWRHQIFWLELLELAAFAVYWVAQTFEYWEGGVPIGPERVPKAAS
jgi:FtsH-binding integral membrane protein